MSRKKKKENLILEVGKKRCFPQSHSQQPLLLYHLYKVFSRCSVNVL